MNEFLKTVERIRVKQQERAAAELVHDLFPAALEAALHEQGVGARS